MDKYQRSFHRDASLSMSENIKGKFNSVIAKLNQDYGLELPFFEDVSRGQIGRLARLVCDEIDELKAEKTDDSDFTTFNGLKFLNKIAADLKEDNDPDSLYNQVKAAQEEKSDTDKTKAKQKFYGDELTTYKRDKAKNVVSFYLALGRLAHEGVDIPEGLSYTDDQRLLKILGAQITRDKGLTMDDASPRLKEALINAPQSVRDVHLGLEYFYRVQNQQEARISEKDLESIDYSTTSFDVGNIIKNMKDREGWEEIRAIEHHIKGVHGY